jgi:phosphopantetheinyl transferase
MAVSLPSARHRGRLWTIPGVVDVWRVDLGGVAHDGLPELLCAQEQARAAQIADWRKRAVWARSRGVLRTLLGGYLDTDPRELRFVSGAHGKPELCARAEGEHGPDGESDLRFNLSHSGELMLVAVSGEREVGVDVERASERYTPKFLRAWTVREATVKCLGTGLGATPVVARGAPEGIWTAELDVGPRAFATVAVTGAECELYLRDWPG